MPKAVDGTSDFMRFLYWSLEGELLFEHYRRFTTDARGKKFGYRFKPHPKALWDWHKPEKKKGHPFDADDYLYMLPEVRAAIDAGSAVWWTEGERDALALVRQGVAATSHHGGARKVFVEQCAWLADAREIVLCLDKDPPGAADGLKRWRGLVERVGVDPGRIRVVYTGIRGCKDVRDHLALGYRLDQLRELPLARLRRAASKCTEESAQRAGYAYVRSPKAGRR